MQVQYQLNLVGTIILSDEKGRTILLNNPHWETGEVESLLCSANGYNWARIELPETLFPDLFTSIKTYHEEGEKGIGLRGYQQPHVLELKRKIESLEGSLVNILKTNNVNLEHYL